MISKTKNGFSLVETMVAVAILSIMLSISASIASGSSRATIMAKEKVIATYLAEEAGEVIMNIWQTQLSAGIKTVAGSSLEDCTGLYGCFVDVIPNIVVESCTDAPLCGGLNLDLNAGYKTNSPGQIKYYRTVKVTQGLTEGEDIEYNARIEIRWGDNSDKTLSFDYHLFPINVRPN